MHRRGLPTHTLHCARVPLLVVLGCSQHMSALQPTPCAHSQCGGATNSHALGAMQSMWAQPCAASSRLSQSVIVRVIVFFIIVVILILQSCQCRNTQSSVPRQADKTPQQVSFPSHLRPAVSLVPARQLSACWG